MWRIIKLFGHALRCILFTSLCVIALGFIALCVYDQRLPQSWTDNLADRLSSSDFLVRIDYISFNVRHGLRIHDFRLQPRRAPGAKAFICASEVSIWFAWYRFPTHPGDAIRTVRIKNLSFPRLPKSYYTSETNTVPATQPKASDAVTFTLPRVAPFRLELENPAVLGIAPRHVSATVACADQRLSVNNITILWPDKNVHMRLTGETSLDAATQRIHGDVWGQALQHNIRPLLEVLDIPIAVDYINAFTEVNAPVNAGCRFDIDLASLDFHLFLDLTTGDCFYHDEPIGTAHGTLDIYSFTRDGYNNARVIIGPITATDDKQHPIRGIVEYCSINNVDTVHFRNVQSDIPLPMAMNIAEVLNDGELDCIQCTTPPRAQINGVVSIIPESTAVTNDLRGTVRLVDSRVFNFPLANAIADFHLAGETFSVSNVSGRARSGGDISGTTLLSFPDYDAERSTFTAEILGSDISLLDVTETLNIANTSRTGRVSGRITLHGPMTTNAVANLSGDGSIIVRDGMLNQMNLFAGMTDYFARHVPGVAALITQSQASMDFTITNGVLRSDNILIEGAVFSIRGTGTYDLHNDQLNFIIRAQLMKRETLSGKIVQTIMWPFTKLLMEFHLFGSLDAPDWRYVSVIDRITGNMPNETDDASESDSSPPTTP